MPANALLRRQASPATHGTTIVETIARTVTKVPHAGYYVFRSMCYAGFVDVAIDAKNVEVRKMADERSVTG